MTGFNTRLFARIISRNREVYLLKILTLSIAFASSVLITLFSLNEFSFDRSNADPDFVFRMLQRNTDEKYSGNRLSSKIPAEVFHRVKKMPGDSLLLARVKIMKEITVRVGKAEYPDQKIHAVDPDIKSVFSFSFVDGSADLFGTSEGPEAMLSSRAALNYFGTVEASGRKMDLFSFGDTVTVRIAAVFNAFLNNTHEDFDVLIAFDPRVIKILNFDPSETGVYGRTTTRMPEEYDSLVNTIAGGGESEYHLQPLPKIYFGPRVLGEEARHGDRYSVIILISISGLILFLALASFMNLTTLTLPYRSKELAIRKLAGTSQTKLLLGFLRESFTLVGISLVIGILILLLSSNYIESILGLRMLPLFVNGDALLIGVILVLFFMLATAPVFLTFKFIRAAPTRLLSTDAITFPKFKRTIGFLQLGISIFLIVVSVVIRRQINYSLLKEPGRNHDQVVYLNCPSGLTNEGIYNMRSNWKKFNPNIIDVMAVSQLPDRINSREIGTDYFTLLVDRGFRDFFDLKMKEGHWFGPNDGDPIFVTNKIGGEMLETGEANVAGIIQDLSGQFNQPEKPVKIRLASDFNYNWLCVRVLEVDIRKTVSRLTEEFTYRGVTADVHYLNANFEAWLGYQDRLNFLSGILTMISGLLSCCAIYGLSVSLVRDKLKQIAVHKLYGALTLHITRLLVMDFAKQMLAAVVFFGPLTYIFLNELLRTFVYSTSFNWLDPVYPVAYCTLIITALCGFQALSLNRSDLTSSLKG